MLTGQVTFAGFVEPVGEDLVNGCAFGPVGGVEVLGDAADLPQVAGFHIGIVTLLKQAETTVVGVDEEVIEIQSGMGNGEFTAPDFVCTLLILAQQRDDLGSGGAVIIAQDTGHLGGHNRGGNVDVQRTDLIGGQCAEGGLILGQLAVIEDSHGSLLGK